MATLTINGASDDLIEVSGVKGEDEFCDVSGHWRGLIIAPDGGTAIVYVDYRPNGCWTVALGQYDEDYALPEWPMKLTVDMDNCSYSTTAVIEVPDGTVIEEYK